MKKNKSTFTINFITYSLMLSLAGVPVYAVDFNTDVLDAADRQNIDFPGSPGPAILCPDSIRWK